jgi:alpha/beta superfamily hydrolase
MVLCHPHPRFGGNRFNPVIDTMYCRLARSRVAVLRFDFRGVGDSEGEHGDGIDERLDVAAAIEQLASATDAPLWLAGYSFGAQVALDVTHPRIDGWVAVAPPLAMSTTERLAATDHRPKHLLMGGHDQFGSPAAIEGRIADWPNTELTVLPAADHFLVGHLDAVSDWAGRVVGVSPPA